MIPDPCQEYRREDQHLWFQQDTQTVDRIGRKHVSLHEEQTHEDDHQCVYGIHLPPAGRIQNDCRLEQICGGNKDSLQLGKMQPFYRLSVE